MTNDEIRMANGIPLAEGSSGRRHSASGMDSPFEFRHSSFHAEVCRWTLPAPAATLRGPNVVKRFARAILVRTTRHGRTDLERKGDTPHGKASPPPQSRQQEAQGPPRPAEAVTR